MKRLFKKNKNSLRQVRHARVRAKLLGTKERPRLSVFRSLRSISAQLIDDECGRTLCSASAIELKENKTVDKKNKVDQARLVGQKLAEKAIALKINSVIFDRGGYKYHGRVKSLAEGARTGGLKF